MPTLIPGRLVLAKERNNKGLTLIELMVAMTIVGLMFALAASGLKSVFNVNLKSASSKLASTLRYLSNKAVTDHVYLRIVYDLEQQSYSVEESSEPFVIDPDESDKGEKDSDGEETRETEAFSQAESRLLQPTKLSSGVFFKDVSVSFLNGKTEHGKAYTYFFPDGYATATVINLRDEDDEEHYAVELSPLSGRVKVEAEYRELEKK